MSMKILKGIVPRSTRLRIRRWLERRRYERTLRAFVRREVEHVYCGHRLRVLLGDVEGAAWYDRDWPMMPELALLARHRLQPGALVFDIGAHQGVVAMMLARLVEPAGTVIAVEPHHLNVELLSRNLELNGIGNIIVRQSVGGAGSGRARMGHQLNDRVHVPAEPGGYDVACVTIDELAAEYGPPNVVFLDVEGFEEQVLAGAATVRTAARTDWFVEVHVGVGLEAAGGSAATLLACFPEPEYEVFAASPDARFVPMASVGGAVASRFMLVAIDKRPP